MQKQVLITGGAGYIGSHAALQLLHAGYAVTVRDYIHVVDLAAGHLAALNYLQDLSAGQWLAVNLGTGNGVSVLDMIKAFETESGQAVPYEVVARRPGDIAACYADANKARQLFNWEGKLGLRDMCADTWRWQSNNPHGYGNVG